MIKQVITIQHKKFATGLFWQPVNADTTPYLYAKQLAEKSEKKYSLYVDYKSMVGLGDVHDGVRAGMPSAAAMVTGALSGFISFLGVFKVEGGFYLVAARNDVIIRDILIESEVDARKFYAELSNIPDWGALFAPASWGMPRSQEKYLQDLLVYGAIEKLHQISITKGVVVSIGLGVGFLILLGLFMYTPVLEVFSPKPKPQINQDLMAEYKRRLEAKNKELDKQFEIVKKEEKLDYPYNHLPDVMERARLCYKAIGFVMQPVFGWNQKTTECDEANARVTFRRKPSFGTLNGFYEYAGTVLPGGVVDQVSNDEIKVQVKLPELKTGISVEQRDQATVMRDILSLFQQIKVKGSVKASSVTVKNGILSEKINVLGVTASSKLIPVEFMQIFNGISGVYMRSVKWDVASRSWNYDIVVYTK